MQFAVTFRHMEATEALKGYVKDKIQRIRKYLPDPIAVHVVMSTERHNHCVDVNMQLHNGLTVAAREASENMYSSIDQVVAKIERQVRRYKDKLRDHKGKAGGTPPIPWVHSVVAENDAPEAEGEDASARPAVAGEAREATPEGHVVMKTEKFHASPMSVAAAIMQLNLLHQQFLVFCSDHSGEVNVVYRRDDGSYGLIETGTTAAAHS
jgi:putative sigma-54 modulation protein